MQKTTQSWNNQTTFTPDLRVIFIITPQRYDFFGIDNIQAIYAKISIFDAMVHIYYYHNRHRHHHNDDERPHNLAAWHHQQTA